MGLYSAGWWYLLRLPGHHTWRRAERHRPVQLSEHERGVGGLARGCSQVETVAVEGRHTCSGHVVNRAVVDGVEGHLAMALRAALFLARPRVFALATGRNGPLMDVFLRVELAQGLAHFRCIEDGREGIEHWSIRDGRETGACRLHFGNERLGSELSLDERLRYGWALFLLF